MKKGRHLYGKIALAVVAFVFLLDALLVMAGLLTWSSLRPLAIGTGCVLVGSLAWECVERAQRPDGTAGLLAWVGLPLSVAAAFLSLPFFALSIYPPLGGFLLKPPVESRFLTESRTVELVFPGNMREEGSNVLIDGERVDASQLEWRGPRTLRIRLAGARQPRPRRVALNALPDAPTLRNLSGQPIAPQHLSLPATNID